MSRTFRTSTIRGCRARGCAGCVRELAADADRWAMRTGDEPGSHKLLPDLLCTSAPPRPRSRRSAGRATAARIASAWIDEEWRDAIRSDKYLSVQYDYASAAAAARIRRPCTGHAPRANTHRHVARSQRRRVNRSRLLALTTGLDNRTTDLPRCPTSGYSPQRPSAARAFANPLTNVSKPVSKSTPLAPNRPCLWAIIGRTSGIIIRVSGVRVPPPAWLDRQCLRAFWLFPQLSARDRPTQGSARKMQANAGHWSHMGPARIAMAGPMGPG